MIKTNYRFINFVTPRKSANQLSKISLTSQKLKSSLCISLVGKTTNIVIFR